MRVPRPLFEFLQPVAAVALLAAVLFVATGVWPPMVAVESESMEPNLERGDLVVVSEPARYGPDGSSVVAARNAEAYRSLGGPGDVVVYAPPGRSGSPIIHRVRFRVEEGENWYDRADTAHLAGAENCEQLTNCPAPHDGYITKGDNNAYYDQAQGLAPPVKEQWLRGEARFHLPWLGEVRLFVARLL